LLRSDAKSYHHRTLLGRLKTLRIGHKKTPAGEDIRQAFLLCVTGWEEDAGFTIQATGRRIVARISG